MTLEMPSVSCEPEKLVKSSQQVNKIFGPFSTIPWPYVDSFSVLRSVNRHMKKRKKKGRNLKISQ